MSPKRALSSRLSWISAVAVIAVAAVLTGTMLASAAPTLPRRTPSQLLVDLQQAKAPSAFSGVITETANLGFPSLPNVGGLNSSTLSALNWISGTHTVDLWAGGPRQLRVAVPVSFGETDLRVNGNQVWLWDSHSQTATHYVLPAGPKRQRVPAHRGIGAAPMTPQQVASKILAAIGPSTSLTVPGSTEVAGRSAYQLQISPRASQSLIDRVVIAVDAKTYVPLQVQIFARGVASPAFSLGFTSLSLTKPAASNFTFTPPAGAHVKTGHLSSLLPGPVFGPLAGLAMIHPGVPGMRDAHGTVFPAKPNGHLLHGVKLNWVRVHGLKLHRGSIHGIKSYRIKVRIGKVHGPKLGKAKWIANAKLPGHGVPSGLALRAFAGSGAGAQILGHGWLSVAVLPNLQAIPGAGGPFGWAGGPPKHPGWTKVVNPPGHPKSSAYSSRLTIRMRPDADPGQLAGLLHTLLNAASSVHGTWGSGKLLRTNLFSVLITSQGKVLIGAVTPAVLYADAAKVK
jgi:outer membrane lipoprotein-sorting protein